MSRVRDAQAIAWAGVRAVQPERLVRSALTRRGRRLRLGRRSLTLGPGQRIGLVAFGKAAVGMAECAERVLGDLVSVGVVVHPRGGRSYHGHRLRDYPAGHPVPDSGSEEGARAALGVAQELAPGDPVLVLISGGGSALLEVAVGGISTREIAATYRTLVESSLPIQRINAVRKHLSQVKGGRLALAWGDRSLVTLALSDVVGDDPASIASGPTVPDPTTYRAAEGALRSAGVWSRVPSSVRSEIIAGVHGRRPETPKPGDRRFRRATYQVIGGTSTAVAAAAREARHRGYRTEVLSTTLVGESARVARSQARSFRYRLQALPPRARPLCLLSGGETTVKGKIQGVGGRNQEFALAAATTVAGLQDVIVLSMGTDGRDGPTDAAGGWVTGGSLAKARGLGLDVARALERHDSHTLLDGLGTLWRTGPTGTNVADLHVLLGGRQTSATPARQRGGSKAR